MYLKADMDLANESGKIKHTVVMIAYKDLNKVMPLSGSPVMSLDNPKLLQHITNSLVTISFV